MAKQNLDRALGNRSYVLIRGDEIQDRMNEIKKRQEFRPWPVILEEFAHQYFDMPVDVQDGMLHVVNNEQFPYCTKDGTSRVQTVTQKQHLGLYMLIQRVL